MQTVLFKEENCKKVKEQEVEVKHKHARYDMQVSRSLYQAGFMDFSKNFNLPMAMILMMVVAKRTVLA